MESLPLLAFGTELAGSLEEALHREWLVTDGTGSYAMGTVASARTRAYHGLLVAALDPPVGRTLVVGGLDEAVTLASGVCHRLHTQEWAGGAVAPRGFERIEEFALEGVLPRWRYALDGVSLERRVWMPRGSRSTMIAYTVRRVPGDGRLRLTLRPLVAWRDHHGRSAAGEPPRIDAVDAELRVTWPHGGVCSVRASAGHAEGGADWYRGMWLRVEAERGLAATEDLCAAGSIRADLAGGETLALTLTVADAGMDPADWQASLAAEHSRERHLLELAGLDAEPVWVRRLALAADAFLVVRGLGSTVIAGYPWFADWGRDTMISLPGLALCTGRPEVSAGLLRTFAGFVDQGMLPNRFPDSGGSAEYNTVDAALWYVEALRAHAAATADESLVDELWPVMEEIVSGHLSGTRHGIGVDPADGLLRIGDPSVQLTWMDAVVDGWVVTPRTGKPVEVNALWYNALRALSGWAPGRRSRHDHGALAERVRRSFDRYWDQARGHLRDVLDGPAGDETLLRPNQLLAVSLHHSPLELARARAVVGRCLDALWTPLGVRSLGGAEPGYTARYLGDPPTRDGAYHQGTVWPWLLGPLAVAHRRAYGDPLAARALLAPIEHHLGDAGLSSISEIADAEPPHLPRGCPWQAWSVAEVLRAWLVCGGG